MNRAEIKLKNETLASCRHCLLSRGVPLPPGKVRQPAAVSVRDARGRALPSEGRVLQRRADGSIEWLLLDVLVNLAGQEETSIFVEPRRAKQPPVTNPVGIRQPGDRVTLTNKVSEVVLSRKGGSLIRRLVINGRQIVDESMLVDLHVLDPGGKIYRASLSGSYKITIPHRNRLRTTVKIEGRHAARDQSTLLDFALRITLTANSPAIAFEHTFYCREPREGKIAIKAIRFVVPTTGTVPSTAFEHFDELQPKAVTQDDGALTLSIWPEWAPPMEIVQGVSKSHVFWLGDGRQEERVSVAFDPAWPAFCEVLDCQHLLRYQPEKYPLLEDLIAPVAKPPAIGMFHFGDLVLNNATLCKNNEDDRQVFVPLQHFLRTGDTAAWDAGRAAARHYMEVDFCEWSTDPRQRGGLIAHTGQHFIGNVYPSHQWAEGLLAYYYLSGDERARNVVISVGDNCCYWAYHVTHLVCVDGREAGMPLVNLAAAYRLTRDSKYIAAAKHIIRNFFLKWMRNGEFQYPDHGGRRFITGYGDWSSFAGLYRLWEVTGDKDFKKLAIRLLDKAIQPAAFSLNDNRTMDFFAVWILGRLTNDMDGALERAAPAIPMLLRRGGHAMRRLHFLKVLDEKGLIDESLVGTRN